MADELTHLDAELGEVDLLIAQARTEAARHETRRAPPPTSWRPRRLLRPRPATTVDPGVAADLNAQLVLLTQRAALMESQVDVLRGQAPALGRYRDALAVYVEALEALRRRAAARASAKASASAPAAQKALADPSGDPAGRLAPPPRRPGGPAPRDRPGDARRPGPEPDQHRPPGPDRRAPRRHATRPRPAPRSASWWPWSSRRSRRPSRSSSTSARWSSTTSGLVPTLRRAARERGRRAGVPVEFDSLGPERRLPMDLESGLFRILDEAMAAYLGVRAERVSIQLDWSDQVEARVSASRNAAEMRPRLDPGGSGRYGSAAGARGDDGGPPRRCPRRRRGRQTRGDRRPAAIDLARDPGPGRHPGVTRRALGRWRRAAPGRRPPASRVAIRTLTVRWLGSLRGQGLVEYGLILALTAHVHGGHPGRLRRDPGRRPRRSSATRSTPRPAADERRSSGVDPPYHQPSMRFAPGLPIVAQPSVLRG